MECLLLSFFVFILGTFTVLFIKPKYKAKLLSIFLIIGLGTVMVPAVISTMKGSSLEINLPYTLSFQTLAFNMDPFSAFITILIAIIGILYGLKIFFTKQIKYKGNLLLFTIIAILLTTFAVNIQNGIYFYLAFSSLSLLMLIFVNLTSENRKEIILKSLPVYLSVVCMTIIIMTLSIFSNSMIFSDMVKAVISSKNCCYFVFILGLVGFAIPALLSEQIVNITKSENFMYSEPLFLWFLFYFINFYCFLRFIGMGAVPSPLCQWICVVFIAVYAIFYTYKLIRTKDIQKTISYTKIIQTTFSILAIIFGVNGYMSGNFNILILGYMAALLFVVNLVFCSFASEMHFKSDLSDNGEISKVAALVAVGSYTGIPATLGFWAWLSFFCTLFFGCFSQELYIEQLSVFIILFSVIVFVAQICKLYSICREYGHAPSEKYFPIFNLIISGMVIIFGIWFSKIFKLFVVPVSFFSGGTRFIDMFQSLGKSVNIISNCILVLAIAVVFGFVLKFFLQKNSNHN